MKPVITGVNANNPSAKGASDGTIVISGLSASVTYGVSFNKDGNADTANGTADDEGNLTISGLSAGHYDGFVVTPAGDGTESSDTSNVTVTIVEPADADAQPAQAANNGGNAAPAPADTTGAALSKKEEVLNNFLSASHGGDDAREAVIVNSEAIINDLKNVRAGNPAVLPATKSLLEIFVNESISHVETATTSLLERLSADTAE